MSLLSFLLPALTGTVFSFVFFVWIATGLVLLVVGLRAARRAALTAEIRSAVAPLESGVTSTSDAVQVAAAAIAGMPLASVLRAVESLPGRSPALPPLSAAATAHFGLETFLDCAARRSHPRTNWSRIAALRLLTALGHAGVIDLLGRAINDPDPEIAGAAAALMGGQRDVRAADALIGALKSGRHTASRIAAALDDFGAPIVDRLRPLLHHHDPTVRYWGAVLVAKFANDEGVRSDLVALARDEAALVRRAAVAALGRIGGPQAVETARALVADGTGFVRAHAARALAAAGGPDEAETIAPLLADREWWVRHAAKESLQGMGEEVWSVLVRYLDHEDAFARNGAAECLQNIGVLDSLIVLEAATARPSSAKIAMLRKIATAGGTRMTEALIDRVDQHARPRVRSLLQSVGLELAGAPS